MGGLGLEKAVNFHACEETSQQDVFRENTVLNNVSLVKNDVARKSLKKIVKSLLLFFLSESRCYSTL